MTINLTYTAIILGAFIVPLLFSFHPKISFHRQWHAFWPANLLVTTVFLAWDILYTEAGIWGFNEQYTLGLALFNLPVEEVLFFVLIPYSAVFTYHCFTLFFALTWKRTGTAISMALIFLMLVAGIICFRRLYTGVTFITLALAVFYVAFILKSGWLNHFYLMYVVILIPFFVVNGLLTGTGLAQPVVWYNDSENLDIRLLTIPVEDIFYGMLLLLLNTALFENFREKHAKG